MKSLRVSILNIFFVINLSLQFLKSEKTHLYFNLKVNKCYPYWPDENTESSHAGIMIKCKSKDVFADFIIRSLTISKVRHICHILHVSTKVIVKCKYPKQSTNIENSCCYVSLNRFWNFLLCLKHNLITCTLKTLKLSFFYCLRKGKREAWHTVNTPRGQIGAFPNTSRP